MLDQTHHSRHETITGDVIQLLAPEEQDDYAIGALARTLAGEGDYIAVIDTGDDWPDGLLSRVVAKVKQGVTREPPPGVADVVVENPEFGEGDTVELPVVPVKKQWYLAVDVEA